MTNRLRESVKLNTVLETFTVWHKVTGDELQVDRFTYDESIHSKTAPEGSNPESESEPEVQAEAEPVVEKPKRSRKKS